MNAPEWGIGSDPEVFVCDNNGKIVPVIGLVGGTKEEPLPLGDGYAVQEDGVALEYNIPVCDTVAKFQQAIKEGLRRAAEKLPPNYGTVIKPDHEFAPEQLYNPMTWVSGCDPDFSAWTYEKRAGLDYSKSAYPRYRYCGGHIHISFAQMEQTTPETAVHIARLMDVLVGVPMRWMEGESIRSQQFAAFGIYRPKVYGLEYRTASNIWLTNDILTEWVADCALYLAKNAKISSILHRRVFSEDDMLLDNAGNVPTLASMQTLSLESFNKWIYSVNNAGLHVSDKMRTLLLKQGKIK